MNYFHFVIGNNFLLSILPGEAGTFFYFSKIKKEKNMGCFFDGFYIIGCFLNDFLIIFNKLINFWLVF